jgi:L-2-hydroxyglutarate oxidase LhgO
MEPNISATMAVLFPDSGIVCSSSLIKHLEAQFLENNGLILRGKEVIDIQKIV